MTNEYCNSCKKKVISSEGTVKFKCPSCKNSEIIRCKECRSKVISYVCADCGFEGPN